MFDLVSKFAVILLSGAVVQCSEVSAGRGKVVDWRSIRSGEEISCEQDAFSVAYLFVSMVGIDAARNCLNERGDI